MIDKCDLCEHNFMVTGSGDIDMCVNCDEEGKNCSINKIPVVVSSHVPPDEIWAVSFGKLVGRIKGFLNGKRAQN